MTHYEVLGVSEEATQAEIKAAYRAAVVESHPDKFQGQPQWVKAEAEVRTKAINEAYSVLTGKQTAKQPKATPKPPTAKQHAAWEAEEKCKAAQAAHEAEVEERDRQRRNTAQAPQPTPAPMPEESPKWLWIVVMVAFFAGVVIITANHEPTQINDLGHAAQPTQSTATPTPTLITPPEPKSIAKPTHKATTKSKDKTQLSASEQAQAEDDAELKAKQDAAKFDRERDAAEAEREVARKREETESERKRDVVDTSMDIIHFSNPLVVSGVWVIDRVYCNHNGKYIAEIHVSTTDNTVVVYGITDAEVQRGRFEYYQDAWMFGRNWVRTTLSSSCR